MAACSVRAEESEHVRSEDRQAAGAVGHGRRIPVVCQPAAGGAARNHDCVDRLHGSRVGTRGLRYLLYLADRGQQQVVQDLQRQALKA